MLPEEFIKNYVRSPSNYEEHPALTDRHRNMLLHLHGTVLDIIVKEQDASKGLRLGPMYQGMYLKEDGTPEEPYIRFALGGQEKTVICFSHNPIPATLRAGTAIDVWGRYFPFNKHVPDAMRIHAISANGATIKYSTSRKLHEIVPEEFL